MKDKYIEKFYDDILCADVKILLEMLASLSNSYRLQVGAADEMNKISLVHRHDVEEAIDRVDHLGEIIDDVQESLKRAMKVYLNELLFKIECERPCGDHHDIVNSAKLIPREIIKDKENRYED